MRPKSVVDQCAAADNKTSYQAKAAGCSHCPPPSHVRRGDDGDRPDPDGERSSVAHHRAGHGDARPWRRSGSRSTSGRGRCSARWRRSFKDSLHLTSFQQALLVAVPVVVGSLGRIPVGALTDRFGGRIMFPLVSLATIVPVLYLGLAGHTSLAGLLVGGFFLGIGGTAFAVGVPFVNAWFPPERRGLADRRVRRRHGRHRDQRADHRQAGQGARHGDPVRDHRDRAGRLRGAWPRWCCATPPAGSCPTEPLPGGWPPPLRLRITWQAVRAVRGRLRRLRRVLRLPARLSEDRLRADPGRRGQPDGRLRRCSPW